MGCENITFWSVEIERTDWNKANIWSCWLEIDNLMYQSVLHEYDGWNVWKGVESVVLLGRH